MKVIKLVIDGKKLSNRRKSIKEWYESLDGNRSEYIEDALIRHMEYLGRDGRDKTDKESVVNDPVLCAEEAGENVPDKDEKIDKPEQSKGGSVGGNLFGPSFQSYIGKK